MEEGGSLLTAGDRTDCRGRARLAMAFRNDREVGMMKERAVKPEPRRKRNQRGEGSRLREELVQAAMRILDSAPGTQLGLRLVAREAGVAAPSVYPHFADARTLMTEIVRECWRQVGEEMEAAAASSLAPDRIGRLKDQFGAFVEYAMGRPSRYQLLFALHPINTEEQYEMQGHMRPAYRPVLHLIEAFASEGGRLPLADTVSTTLLLISLAHGRIALAHLAPDRAGNSAQAVKEFVFDAVDSLFPSAT
ncbi:TetR/AcrR family transcriptional regulator [Novosphingobium sp. G106]|uniref:TetR/AcrR family transcriptional regulator n=1 Tax=Novosphingobium sp. G106 TaxID=2849500 RepID=UPI001C2CD3C8|nr:TetR/AcrR family transcriptional regulator [Novosphingobium sp. G106]MBV1689005.1 TetR/AcrR family transcriptional regulator [Novosphingobium sp. G106]